MRSTKLRAALLAAGLFCLATPASPALAVRSTVADPAVASSASRNGRVPPQAKRVKKTRRRAVPPQPRIFPAHTPRFLATADPYPAKLGDRVLVTVRLTGAAGTARKAAFHLTANPAMLRYVGPVPTGAGALLIEPSSVAGEIVVYRSSVPEGFAETEELVELEYEAVAAGSSPILLTEPRLFDGAASEIKANFESGSFVIE